MKKKERLDKILVDKGLVKSRERAKALIMEGKVIVDGNRAVKAGALVGSSADIILKGNETPCVSRGGMKLEAALAFFGIGVEGKIVMDIGCSTGGFTDCALKKKALKVYAIDVGYGQFDWALRKDPRVQLFEKTNIRYLEKKAIPDPVAIVLIDVSFISLSKVLPKVLEFLTENGEVLALIKPQFEVGKGMVDRGGVVKDDGRRMLAVENVRAFAETIGFRVIGLFECPIRGQKGNREFFMYLGRR